MRFDTDSDNDYDTERELMHERIDIHCEKSDMKNYLILLFVLYLSFLSTLNAEEPALPEGLGGGEAKKEEPALPSGLAGESEKNRDEPGLPPGLESKGDPALPEGLGNEQASKKQPKSNPEYPSLLEEIPIDITGFWDTRFGGRLQEDRHQRQVSIGETRLQVEMEKGKPGVLLRGVIDFVFDPVLEKYRADLEAGKGWLDIRELNMTLTPFSFMDLKLGRQILTWGTGDMIFINDMFPKDWQSFFIGRDEQYLKAPSDALKSSFFSPVVNLDFIVSPKFDSDRYIRGERISYWNSLLGRRAGRNDPFRVREQDEWFDDYEYSWRLYRNISGRELALYGYRGFWKSPGGFDSRTLAVIFPRLAVYGASLRATLLGGIGNVEAGYYDSMDDRKGDDPFVNNDELRFLIGYERELMKDFTGAFQYYVEYMMDYEEYQDSLPPGTNARDELRHVITVRLTRRLMNQDMNVSLFAYASPSDMDAYLRPRIHYKFSDRLAGEIGGNVFAGDDDHTFFGQFEKNTNLYAAIRLYF